MARRAVDLVIADEEMNDLGGLVDVDVQDLLFVVYSEVFVVGDDFIALSDLVDGFHAERGGDESVGRVHCTGYRPADRSPHEAVGHALDPLHSRDPASLDRIELVEVAGALCRADSVGVVFVGGAVGGLQPSSGPGHADVGARLFDPGRVPDEGIAVLDGCSVASGNQPVLHRRVVSIGHAVLRRDVVVRVVGIGMGDAAVA